MAELKSFEYPEMKSSTTVFILMNLQTSKEMKLIEKLYALDEVKEIYSVHGVVDLLVKVQLTRDLLSSDAEVISQFVYDRVRQLSGIISTNTLIPGFSKIKAPLTDLDNSGDSK
jgi:hypothetical protein